MKKIIVIVVTAALLACMILPAGAAGTPAETGGVPASVSAKDEIVYAKLSYGGDVSGIYVVNCFDAESAGKVTDYGDYTSVVNLTDGGALTYENGAAGFTVPEGRFYYQGDMDQAETELPWLFDITYRLDGKPVGAESLGGKSGGLDIVIKTSANPDAATTAFYDNYLLQITLTLDTGCCRNIKVDGATVANAGTDKQIAFSALPGTDAEFICRADVTGFEMAGISIAAVPYGMDLDSLDLSEFTDGLGELSDGIAEVDKGVSALKDGVKELNSGAWSLSNGASRLESGAVEMESGANELIGGFDQINSGLSELDAQSAALASGSESVKSGLGLVSQSIQTEIATWDTIAGALAQSGVSLTYKQAAVMDESDPTLQRVAASVEGLTAAQIVACAQMKLISESSVNGPIVSSIGQLAQSYGELNGGIAAYTAGVSAIAQGVATLSGSLGTFKSGLSDFSTGIAGLSEGARSLAGGTDSLYDGVSELGDGTSALRKETSDMPARIEEELSGFTGTGKFEPVSFTDERNADVELVQFVFATDPIEEPEAEKSPAPEPARETFWDKLKALFMK